MKGFPMGKKLIKASCRVIGTILVDIPISLLPTPSRIFPIRWAHSWALTNVVVFKFEECCDFYPNNFKFYTVKKNYKSLVNNTKYEPNVKISNKKYRATWNSVDWSTRLISKRPNYRADYQSRRFYSNYKNKSLNSHAN